MSPVPDHPLDGIDPPVAERAGPRRPPSKLLPCRKCGTPTPIDGPFSEIVERLDAAICPECVPASRAELASHVELPSEDRSESAIRAVLADLGLNVEAHGRKKITEIIDSFPAGVQREIRQFCRDLPRTLEYEPVQGLFLVGPMGVGKSLLAGAVLRWALESGLLLRAQLCYISARTFISGVKTGYGDGTAHGLVTQAIRAKLLVLDELGTEHATADTVATLTEIMSGREQRPTIITSNLRRDEVGGRYSDGANEHVQRLAARLQVRNFRVVPVTGNDWRGEAAA